MSDRHLLPELEAKLGSQLTLLQLGRVARAPVVGERYEVDRLIGRGAFGLVVRARDLQLGRQVAIKLVPSSSIEHTLEAVMAEARALADLDTPEVATIYDCRRDDISVERERWACSAIVMEYVAGVNLRRWKQRRPEHSDMLGVLCSAARGLEAAHAANIVHRDFKPDNVVVNPAKQARVVDFGLAYRLAALPKASTSLRRTRGQPVYGTPAYMAPEVCRGEISPSSDQYAFAVTAWELLTGRLPFAEGTAPGPAPHGLDQLPSRLAAALQRALAPSPSQRFPTLSALRAELELCQESAWSRSAPYLAAAAVAAGLATSFFVGSRHGRPEDVNEVETVLGFI